METTEKGIMITEEALFEDPLYCTFSELLHTVQLENGLSSQEIWLLAKERLHRLSISSRPDLMVSSLVDELCQTYSTGDTVAVILICMMYMIGCQDKPANSLWEAGKRIGAVIAKHPLCHEVERYQRMAEEREEENGNLIPNQPYLEMDLHNLKDRHPFEYGHVLDRIPGELLSCIADKARFDEYCQIIRNEILPFIKSDEGTAQLWEVIFIVSKDLGFVSLRCKRKPFARLIEIICPEAGPSSKIDQNMQKYNRIMAEKENDLCAIRSRFQKY